MLTTPISIVGTAVYLFLWPEDGILRKEDVRAIFDGSIFYTKAEEYATKQEELRRQGQTGLIETSKWLLSSLLTAAFFIALLPYAMASLFGMKVKEMLYKMQDSREESKH